MKRHVVSVLIVVLMVSSFGIIVSCSLEKPRSLDNVSVNFDSHPEFVLKSSKGVSEKNIEKDLLLIDSLNKALADYPELSSMLEADTIDGGSNDYIYEGSEPFFKTLNEFADENYKKAKSMFPEITEEQFYYNAAIGYGIANEEEIEFEILSTPVLGENDKTEKNSPTFNETMIHSFWASYLNTFFNNNVLVSDSVLFGDIKTLDSDTDLRFVTNTTLILYEYFKNVYHDQYVIKKIEMNKEYSKLGSKDKPNYVLTGSFLELLGENDLFKFERLEITDYFIEIGIESLVLNYLLSGIRNSQPVKIGYILGVSAEYLGEMCRSTFTISGIGKENIVDAFVRDIFLNENLDTDVNTEPWRIWLRWKKNTNIDFSSSIRNSG